MDDTQVQGGKRVPIRRRVLTAILAISLAILAAAVVTSIFFMDRMMREGEAALSDELSHNLSNEVEQKASKTDVMLDAYKGYMEFVRDYTENMYPNYDELVATGKFVDSSRASTGEGVYALQSGFASDDYDLDSYHDEMYFFSHLESILDPLAKENEDEISTIYLGTKSGMLISYDKWSSLSPVPEPDFFVYDFTKSEWYTQGMEEDDIFFTSLYVDAVGRGLTITIATPFKDQNGEAQGVLAADFDITGIYNEMISMGLASGSSSFAINKDNEIISIDSEDEVLAQDYLNLSDSEIAQMTSGESGIIETDDAFFAYAPIEDVGWTLCAMVPRTALMEKVESLEHSFHMAMVIFLLISIALVIAGVAISSRVSKSITHPIELLVEDMRIIADGDLDHKASAYRNDEIGDMTVRLNEMVERLKETIHDLVSAQARADEMHELAQKDALTSVKNKGAFYTFIQGLQDELDRGEQFEFAIGVFDCDNLKAINDQYGHDKGDEYLKTASRLICRIFKHSPVFRVGGDEFAVGLRNDDFQNREELVNAFMQEQEAICESAENTWDQVHVALGVAVYDPNLDNAVIETAHRADKIMYENKNRGKGGL